jgi:hypothetical protein
MLQSTKTIIDLPRFAPAGDVLRDFSQSLEMTMNFCS